MAEDVGGDQLAIIRIEGMHCHKCELGIQKALSRVPGVHEVEVDFPSGQASVLFDKHVVRLGSLLNAISEAGYAAAGVMTNTDQAAQWVSGT